MSKYKEIDSYTSFRNGEKKIEQMVKDGRLSREEAYQTIKEAREAYKNQTYNRQLNKLNEIG